MTFPGGIFATVLLLAVIAVVRADETLNIDSPCFVALQRFPKPDATYTAKHLWNICPELCRNSSGHFPTGQFPHPWDCNAFINCYQDDAWVHWCQVGLNFNENNMQCDWPRNVNCKRVVPQKYTQPDGTTRSQWEFISTTPSSVPGKIDDKLVVTCKDSDFQLNVKEYIGPRPDLCTEGTGNYRAPDCRFYVKCVDTRAYIARCPGGFVFDPVGRQCDWPSKNPACLKSCTDAGNFDKPTPIFATTQSPVTTTLSVDIRTANLSCNESHCVPKKGCQPELCAEPNGQFEIPGECGKFANCWKSCAYETPCPPGTVYSAAIGRCDSPWSLPADSKCFKSNPAISASGSVLASGAIAGSSSKSTGNAGQDQDV